VASGHRCPFLELGSLPSTRREDIAQRFGCVPNIDVPDIERAEAESKQVRRAKRCVSQIFVATRECPLWLALAVKRDTAFGQLQTLGVGAQFH